MRLWMNTQVEAARKLRKFLPDGLGFLREVGANEICRERGDLEKTVESEFTVNLGKGAH